MTYENLTEYNRMLDEMAKLHSKIIYLNGVIADKNELLESAYESTRKLHQEVASLEGRLEEKNALLDSYESKELQNTVHTLETQLAAQEVISQALLTQLMLKAT